MKILGIGVDIVQNTRIKKLIKNKNFIKRTFGNKEIILAKKFSNKTNYFAKRFAAKESLAKALGTGFRGGLNLKDIEILNDRFGKPYYHNTNKLNKIINNKYRSKDNNLFLSISDETDYSISFTIISKN